MKSMYIHSYIMKTGFYHLTNQNAMLKHFKPYFFEKTLRIRSNSQKIYLFRVIILCLNSFIV